MSLILLLAFVPLNLVQSRSLQACWGSDNQDEVPKYWKHGNEIVRGRYWYKCNDGYWSPRGCIDPDGNKVGITDRFEREDYEMTCILDDDRNPAFEMTACLPRFGGRYEAGEAWNEPKNRYWFICEQQERTVRITTAGCVTLPGERIKVGEKRIVGNYNYECQRKPWGSVSLCAIACVTDGNIYQPGQYWTEGRERWFCKQEKNRTAKVCVENCYLNVFSFIHCPERNQSSVQK